MNDATRSQTYNYDGWAISDLRTWLQEDLYEKIQQNVHDAIVMVNKTYKNNGGVQTISDSVWIPSTREVGVDGYENSGVIYSDIFKNDDSRLKRLNGNLQQWRENCIQYCSC